jgi:hypothetical protein
MRRLAAFSSVEIEPRYPSLVGLARHPPGRPRTLGVLPIATTLHVVLDITIHSGTVVP